MHDEAAASTSRYISRAEDLPLNGWRTFRKLALTKAQPITGPCIVKTREGEYGLPADWRGWVALDSGGYPYPIAEEEFATIYEEIAP